jgi:hypothetical protein
MNEYDECVDFDFEKDFTSIPKFSFDDLVNNK